MTDQLLGVQVKQKPLILLESNGIKADLIPDKKPESNSKILNDFWFNHISLGHKILPEKLTYEQDLFLNFGPFLNQFYETSLENFVNKPGLSVNYNTVPVHQFQSAVAPTSFLNQTKLNMFNLQYNDQLINIFSQLNQLIANVATAVHNCIVTLPMESQILVAILFYTAY